MNDILIWRLIIDLDIYIHKMSLFVVMNTHWTYRSHTREMLA